jgi:hypothetical protein
LFDGEAGTVCVRTAPAARRRRSARRLSTGIPCRRPKPGPLVHPPRRLGARTRRDRRWQRWPRRGDSERWGRSPAAVGPGRRRRTGAAQPCGPTASDTRTLSAA